MPGHGKSQHEAIVSKTRRLLVSYEFEEVHFCIGDDNLVEVGTYTPDKWDVPVIHISPLCKVTGIGLLSPQSHRVRRKTFY